VEDVEGAWLISVCSMAEFQWYRFSYGRILVARSTFLRLLLVNTRLLASFAVSLRCFCRSSRPWGFSVVGAWASRASAFFLIWACVGLQSVCFFGVYGGASGDWRFFGVWGLRGCSGAGACVTRAATDGGSPGRQIPL